MNEIFDRLRAVRGWTWALVALVGLAAAAASLALSYPPETRYRTTGILGVDPLATSANDRVDFLRNLRAAAFSQAVLEEVSQETGLPVARLENGLELQRIGDSNLTRVVYVSGSDDAETARAVVAGVVSSSQQFLHEASSEELAARADEATDRLRDAEVDLRDVEARIRDAVQDNDGIPPDVEFDAMQRQLADLRLRRVTTNAAEDPAIATQLDDAIADVEQQLPAAASAAAEHRQLLDEQDVASGRVATLEQEVADAQEAVRASQVRPDVVIERVAEPMDGTNVVVRQVVVSTLAALVVAVFVALLRVRTSVPGRDERRRPLSASTLDPSSTTAPR